MLGFSSGFVFPVVLVICKRQTRYKRINKPEVISILEALYIFVFVLLNYSGTLAFRFELLGCVHRCILFKYLKHYTFLYDVYPKTQFMYIYAHKIERN